MGESDFGHFKNEVEGYEDFFDRGVSKMSISCIRGSQKCHFLIGGSQIFIFA